jgi:sugar-specific transcriptional regulator TrmB
MTQLKDLLKKIGLTDREASIYLAGLSYPSVSANELAKLTQIKRPTVYHALETLIQKGLVSKKTSGNKRAYRMTAPEMMKRFIDQKMRALEEQKLHVEELIPILQQRQQTKKNEAIQVTQYEGIEGVKMVVDEALYCKEGKWDIIAPSKNFFSDFDKAYAEYFLKTRKRRKIISRSLWEKRKNKKTTPGGRKVTEDVVKERDPRYLPKVMHGRFKSVIILFDDKVAIISSIDKLSAILIQSQEMHETMTAMFEGLWSVSEPYKN